MLVSDDIIHVYYLYITKIFFLTGKSIGIITESVSTRTSKEENDLLAHLKTELKKGSEYRIRQEERTDERRRREDHRLNMQMKMMMVMLKSQVTAPIPHLLSRR